MKNLLAAVTGVASNSMGYALSTGRKTVKPPSGCEGHLTRREVAIRLGLPSEFKVRQFEREGRLHAVRGRMGTAFYPEAEVLALRAELGVSPLPEPGCWTDADLLTLLQQPTSAGRPRTAVDLVTEAKISIARAERVYRFWSEATSDLARALPRADRHPSVEPNSTAQPAPSANPQPKAIPPSPPPPTATPAQSGSKSERRSSDRMARDQLVRSLRDPDPCVRDRAFARLKEGPRL
ncbi:MAG TPA: hypothetical protein VF518_01195 [Polyangia bacterium]